jgi:hypothetical protein
MEYWGIPIATLLYLILDIYPQVKSFRGIFQTVSFWLYWLLFSIFAAIGLAILKTSIGDQLGTAVGNNEFMKDLVLSALSTAGALTILQSFTLKLAEYKFVDLGAYVENFRKQVLADISATVVSLASSKQRRMGNRLATKYAGRSQELKNAYAMILSFGGRDLAQIGTELEQLEEQSRKIQVPFEEQLALRIAKADPKVAEELNWKKIS